MTIREVLNRKRIISAIIRRLNGANLFLSVRQVIESKSPGQKILIVASGALEIPTDGWGAVEKIISEIVPLLEEVGFAVSLLNSKHSQDWREISKKRFDLVLCHDDATLSHVYKFFPSTPVIAVSHYGSLPKRKLWDKSFIKTFTLISKANLAIALSESCKNAILHEDSSLDVLVCPNGLSMEEYVPHSSRNRAVYLGKVEDRKRQIEIFMAYPELGIDFVGPCSPALIEKTRSSNGVRFLGPKDKMWLKENLSKYEIGLLFSYSEADALVLYEYQNAGLNLLVSKDAAGSQDLGLPWIKISQIENLRADMQRMRNKIISPETIIIHAFNNYSWNIRIGKYIEAINRVLK